MQWFHGEMKMEYFVLTDGSRDSRKLGAGSKEKVGEGVE